MKRCWLATATLVILTATACGPPPNPLLTATGPDLVVETWRMRLALDCPDTEFDTARAADLREALADLEFDYWAYPGMLVASRQDRDVSDGWAAEEAGYQREFGSLYGHCPALAYAAGVVNADGFQFAVGVEYGP